jgi:hypothetical protein
MAETVAEMAEGILAAGSIDPALCRANARERFCESRMVERYLAVYRDLATGRRAGAA